MISRDSVQTLIGGNAYTNDGDKIGSIGQVYLDNSTGEPAWVTVKTGLFGTNESFVPLDQAELTDDGVRVPYDKDRVKNAPNIELDRELSEQEEDQLYSYYGLAGSGTTTETTTDTSYSTTTGTDYGTTSDTGYGTTTDAGYGTTTETVSDTTDTGTSGYAATGTTDYSTTESATTSGYAGTTGTAEGYDTSGPTTDDAMTRSEERVRAGTETREAGRARLRKYVTTEQQQVTVPVTREEVRLEREPITDENRDEALSGPDFTESEHEVTLTEERPVVTTEAVPVERVRLAKDQVQDEETVNVDVRKEQIETDADGTTLGDDDLRGGAR